MTKNNLTKIAGEQGKPLFEVLNSITFAEHSGKTTLIIHASVTKATAATAPYLKGMNEGWKQSLDRLEEHMAKF